MIDSMNIFSSQFLQNLKSQCKNRPIPTKSILEALKHSTHLNNQYKQQIKQLSEQLQNIQQEKNMLSNILDQLRMQNQQYRQIKEKRWKVMNDKQMQLLIQNQSLKNTNRVLVQQVQLLKKKIKVLLTQDKQYSFDCSVEGQMSLFQSAKFNNYVNFQDKQHSTNQNTKARISLEESQNQKQSEIEPQIKNIFNYGIQSDSHIPKMVQFKKVCSSQQIIVDSPKFIKRQLQLGLKNINEKSDSDQKQAVFEQNKQKRRSSKQYTFYKIQTNKSIQEEQKQLNIDDRSSIMQNRNIISDSSQFQNQHKYSQQDSNKYLDESGLLNDIYSNTESQQFQHNSNKFQSNLNTITQTKMRKTNSAILTPQQVKQIQQASKLKIQKNTDNKNTKKHVNVYPAINSYNQTQSYKTIIFNKEKSPKQNKKNQSIKIIENNINPLQNKSKEISNSVLKESISKSTVMSKSTAIINKHKQLMSSKIRSKQKKNSYANIHSRKLNQGSDSQEINNASNKSLIGQNNIEEAPVLIYNQDQDLNCQ